MRLYHYATPGSRAYAALEAAVHPALANPAPFWVVSCADDDVFEELMATARLYSGDDAETIYDAFVKAVRLEAR